MPFFSGGGSTVTSANIVDGEIVNADISPAAAIALTKLAGADANGFNAGILDPTALQYAVINVSSADILGFGVNTGKTIVAAPGAGKVVVITGYVWELIYNSIPYVNGFSCNMYYSGTATNTGTTVIPTAGVTNAANTYYTSNTDNQVNLSTVANLAVIFGLTAGTTFITGNSTAKIHVLYRIITL